MQVVRKSYGKSWPGTTFTGKTTLTALLDRQEPGGMSLTIVTFEDGSVTNWHDHPGEQILYILSGQGRVGTAETRWQVGPGDVIYVPPGERHWHGAEEGHTMTHISVTNVGPPTWYEEAPF
ncbi:MAG TPA: cupin domain-containing protein [Anaerolineales bacterium]|nr:cupin domain-containing protein [Anaerolineales bacterium]